MSFLADVVRVRGARGRQGVRMRLPAVTTSYPRPSDAFASAHSVDSVPCGGLAVGTHAPIAVDTLRPELCGAVTQALALACGAEFGRVVEPGWPRRLALGAVGRPPVVFVSAANVTACGVGFLACARGAIGQVLAEDDDAAATAGVWLGLGILVGAVVFAGFAAMLVRPGRALPCRVSPDPGRARARWVPPARATPSPPPSYGAVTCGD